MNKKFRTIIIFTALLVLSVLTYVVVTIVTKDKDEDTTGDADAGIEVTAAKLVNRADGEYYTGISLKNDNCSLEFEYGSDNSWHLKGDDSYPVSVSGLEELTAFIDGIDIVREIGSYGELSEYGLDTPALSLSFETSAGIKESLLFSSISPDGNSYYFMSSVSKKLYITGSTMYTYSTKQFYDFIEEKTVPMFKVLDVNRISVVSDNIYTLYPSTDENGDRVYEYTTLESDGERTAVHEQDNKVINSFLNEMVYNKVFKHNPTDDELAACGLKDTNSYLTVDYTSTKGDIAELSHDESAFNEMMKYTYILQIGNKTGEDSGQYFVRVSCKSEDGEASIYDSDFIYTMNSYYCDYIKNFSYADLDGTNSTAVDYLPDETVPKLKSEYVSSITIRNEAGDETVINRGEDGKYYIAGSPEEPVSSANETLINEYIFNSSQLDFGDYIADYDEETSGNFGIVKDGSGFDVTFTALAVDYEGNTVSEEMSWSLYIGDKNEEGYYYVSASNSECIYLMQPGLCEFILGFES